MSRSARAERCFPSLSPTLRPWIDGSSNRTSSYVEGLWSPISACRLEMRTLKLTLIRQKDFRRTAAEIFLSQAGPRVDLEPFQAEHHLLFDVVWSPFTTKKATRFGSPSSGLLLRLRI